MPRKTQQNQQGTSRREVPKPGGGQRGAQARAPIEGYNQMSQQEIMAALDSLTADEIEQLVLYEAENKNRTSIVKELNRRLEDGDNEDVPTT